MSWTDEEIDDLFREGAKTQSFEYDNAYFSEIEAALPVNGKGKDFLWLGTALVFVAVLTTGYFVNSNGKNTFNTESNQLAHLELNENEKRTAAETTVNGEALTGNQAELIVNTVSGSSAAASSVGAITNNGTSAAASTNEKGVETNTGATQSMYDLATRNVRSKTNSSVVDKSALELSKTTSATVSAGKQSLIKLRNDSKVGDQHKFDFVRTPITAGLDVNAANLLDQEIDQNLQASALPVLGELRPKAAFFVELNGGMSQSLVTPSEYTSRSFGGGVGVESYLGNFSLTTGLNVKISDHQDLVLTREAGKLYSYGSTIGVDQYDFNKLYSIEMPISLGYNLNKHNFNIGVRPSLLIAGQMKHEVYGNGELMRSNESTGLIDGGLKIFGLKPTVGYAYRMNQWMIGANIGVQLMQSVEEQYIKGMNNPFPIDGQIYIRRTIRLRR